MLWNIGYPVNWNAPLNWGLMAWVLRPPVLVSNARWLDLLNKNHGTLVNGPIWSGATHPGGWGSLDFDGTNDSVNLGTGLRPTTSISVAFWLYRAVEVGHGIIYNLNYNAGAYYGFNVYRTGTSLYWRAGEGNTGDPFIYANVGSADLGVWSHSVITWSNNVTAFYRNGKAATSTSGATNATQITYTGVTDLLVGSEPSSGRLNGNLDDIRIYSRVLAADEVMRLYTASATGYRQELNWIEEEDWGTAVAFIPLLIKPFSQAVARASRY